MAGYVPVPRAASAEGARIETLKAPRELSSWGGGVPLPSRLDGLGSVVSSPSGVRGRQRILGLFQDLRSLLVETMYYGV